MSSSSFDSEYFYLPLRDAKKALNMRVNLMGKVSKIWDVLKTRGSGYALMLKLVDLFEPPPGVSVNLFSDSIDKLPKVRSNGDIISLHHVEMRVSNGEFFCTFNGKLSSFALFNGDAFVDLYPYQTSINYQAADNDKKLLMQLRAMPETFQVEHGLSEPLATLFCNLRAEEKLDIVCKVLHASDSNGDLVFLVWDSTDSPPATLQIDLDMEGLEQICLHPEVSHFPRKALCTFPRIGSILKLTVSKEFEYACQLKVGFWIKLYNIIFEVQSGLWKGALTPTTYIQNLSDEDNNVQIRQRIFICRTSSVVDRLPFSIFPRASDVTETDFAYSSYSTLMESLTYPKLMHNCRTVVRVVSMYPSQAKDLRSLTTCNYRVRLTIEDSTARIHAYIFGEDGEKFFHDCPSVATLTKKLNVLLGTRGENIRNPPWVWCCLKSYFLDENDPWNSRRYRIFGTTLLG